MTFLERAQTTASRGVPVIRLRPRTKIPEDLGWPELATTDEQILSRWDTLDPDANCGSVSFGIIGHPFFFEVDHPSVIQRIESETGHKIPRTYRVRSSVGKGHFYFKHTHKSIDLGNISQGDTKHGDFSVRAHRQFVVSAKSVHPISGNLYEIVSDSEIVDIPDWLVDWLATQKLSTNKQGVIESPRNEQGLIPHGSIHTYMLREAGRLRAQGLSPEEIEPVLLRLVHENCQSPIDESRVIQMARSVGKYEPLSNPVIFVEGKIPTAETHQPAQASVVVEEDELPNFVIPPYPRFPDWVLQGTSLYEGFIKPFCDVNSRYESFLFIPAVTLMLNYLGGKVRIEGKDVIPSIFTVLIGQKGRVIKSSSVNDAIRYFKFAGLVDQAGTMTRNAEGKTLVWTAGSPEGLGLEAQRTNCKNICLFYDELSTLTSKAGIESSTLISCLLNIYESGQFANTIKARKETYSLEAGSYCASLIACTTDRNFKSLWGKMSGVTSGLNDRFFFLLQPEKLKSVTPPVAVNTAAGALKTRELIDKAIQKGVYKITDSSPLAHAMNGSNALENRQEIRAEKFALYFAIDLDRQEIDEDCIERGLALVEYEKSVKRKLRPNEAITKEAQIQNDIVDYLLTRENGMSTYRDLERMLHPERYGTSLWFQAYSGLQKAGQIKIIGSGKRSDPKIVTLLRAPEESED